MSIARDRMLRWTLLGVLILAAGAGGVIAVSKISGLVGALVAGAAAMLALAVELALDGPWRSLQRKRSQLREATTHLREVERGRMPLIKSVADAVMASTVHPSIPLPSGGSGGISPTQPLYIPRTIDSDLDRLLAAAPSFPVLVGPSAAGKTRTAIAAITRTLPDWRLCWPATAGHLNELIANGGPSKRTVVLLDELNMFLFCADPLAAVTIEQLLRTDRQIVVIGTMNSILFDGILASSSSRNDAILSQARQLLRRCVRLDVDSTFDAAELQRAKALVIDPRIAEALEKSEGRVAEYLAAVPALRARYRAGASTRRGGAALGAHLVKAAAMCRLAGHPNPVPVALLREATLLLLSRRDRGAAGSDWFDHAAEWACEPVREVSLLAASAETPGMPDAYDVHDAVLSLGTTSGEAWIITQALWELVAIQCSVGSAIAVGYAAALAGELTVARAAWSRAAAVGNAAAIYNLGTLLQDEGDLTAAEEMMRSGAEAGGAEAMFGYGILLAERGAMAEAEAWLAKSASNGSPEGMYNFASFLYRNGERARALRWFEKAANYGIVPAVYSLGHLLAESDDLNDLQQAMLWFYRGAEQLHDLGCRFRLGSLYFEGKHYVDAERHYRIAAEGGHPAAMGQLGMILMMHYTGRLDEAEHWIRQAVEAGHVPSIMNLSSLLKMRGNFDEALAAASQWSQAVSDDYSFDGTEFGIHLPDPRPPSKAGPTRKASRERRRRS